jgi:hypothetical protein
MIDRLRGAMKCFVIAILEKRKKRKGKQNMYLCRARCKDKSSTSRELVCQYLF